MRLYLDDDIASSVLVRALRQAGHDVQIPSDAGLSVSSDPAHLTHALREGRVTMTRNHEDFEELHLLIRQAQGTHPRIFAIRRDNEGEKVGEKRCQEPLRPVKVPDTFSEPTVL